ncbi:MAG: hypothetical protein ACK4Q5_20110 [Saprospiraceae bacterium]
MKKSFKDWKTEELELAFGLRPVKDHPMLTTWLGNPQPVPEDMKKSIREIQSLLQERINFWNEDELKFQFIGPFMRLLNLNGDRYSTFSQRAIVEDIPDVQGKIVSLKGIPEVLVALGKQDPRQPFFFIKEYKPERGRDKDPQGQLLAAMFAAQQKNALKFPLKGCYVVGRNWFFVILNGLEYAVSDAYVSTQDDLFDIYSNIKKVKQEIEDFIATHNLT